jgi:hypothetical protein
MKEIATTILRNFVRAFGVLALFAFATVSSTSAKTITKPFEIGAGTAQPRSQFRTFAVPCGTRMTTSVTYSRSGDAGANNDVPLFIEVRKPGATEEEDGPVATVQENLTATRVPKTANLPAAVSDRGGCSIPWRVRVRHDAAGPAPNVVSGNITVSFVTPTIQINVAGGLFALKGDKSVTKNVGDSQGMSQGTVVITGTWNHSVLGAVGPLSVELALSLIDPSGTVVKSASGVSSNEIREEYPKLKLTHRITDCTPGQWKLKITNMRSWDAMNIDVTVKFTPDCP